jgi:outer membrane protein assembly factor BamB
MSRFRVTAVAAAIVVAAAVVGGASSHGYANGTPPPEIGENAATGWPEHNFDLSNSRADLQTDINASNVSTLKQKWAFKLSYSGAFGAFTSNPIVLNNVVYFEDPDSNVFALNESTGAKMWEHKYKSITPSGGPNGVALGYGLLYGATENKLFALDPTTGKQVWISRQLTTSKTEGIDMAPQLYGGKVLISTIPGASTSFYAGNAYGKVYALDAKTGKVDWMFSTVKGGQKLWGNAKYNSGGGLWYPPSVDSQGRVFIGVANPAPFPLSAKSPNGSTRPGPNLYTDSLVALNGDTGKVLWYQQVTSHDLRDYDFQVSPVITNESVGGVQTEVVIGAGKSGKVIAFRADNGKRLWTLNIGKHNSNQYGPLPKKPVTVCPGYLGGVETPMALNAGLLYVPWVDLCAKQGATGFGAGVNFASGKGGLAAVNASTGAITWKHTYPTLAVGAATIANDVVFTETYSGTIYAYNAKTGAVLWTTKAANGINSFPAITKNMFIIGAGAPSGAKKPLNEIVAYSLNGQ